MIDSFGPRQVGVLLSVLIKEIPISGPKGKGTIYVEARKSAGHWSFLKLFVEVGVDGERIDLQKPGELPESPGQGPSTGPDINI